MPNTAIELGQPAKEAEDRVSRIAKLEGFNKAHCDSAWERLQPRLNMSHLCISA